MWSTEELVGPESHEKQLLLSGTCIETVAGKAPKENTQVYFYSLPQFPHTLHMPFLWLSTATRLEKTLMKTLCHMSLLNAGHPKKPGQHVGSSLSSTRDRDVTLSTEPAPGARPGIPLYWSWCKVTASSWHSTSNTCETSVRPSAYPGISSQDQCGNTFGGPHPL